MGDQDPGAGPSLELPSLGLGRKRRKKQAGPEQDVRPDDGAAPEPDPAPGAGAATRSAVEATPAPEATPVPESAREPEPQSGPQSEPQSEPARHEPQHEPAQTEAALEPVPATPAVAAPRPRRPRRAKQPKPARETREFTLPAAAGHVAAGVTGVVVGTLAVLLTGLSTRLCEVVRGTASCGGTGFLLLVAILILLTYVGGWMLRAWRITDPLSTSFLAVGLMAVLAMLFLVDALFEWWMIIVIPLLAAATYVLSWWVTTSLVDAE